RADRSGCAEPRARRRHAASLPTRLPRGLASQPPRPERGRFTTVSPDFHQMSTLGSSGGGDTRSMQTAMASVEVSRAASERPLSTREIVFDIDDLSVSYGETTAFSKVSLDVYKNLITAVIGPSGCGKSTFIRCLNRMNDLVPSASVGGKIVYHGEDLYGPDADPVEVRRRIGM